MQKMIAIGVALGLLGLIGQQQASAQGTVFTYQGKLNQNGVAYTGVAEIAPTLWDAASGGNPIGTNNPTTILVNVSTGLFTASLDFGSSPFVAGAARWLQLGVRTTLGPFTTLSPLQPLTATPYAIAASYATKGGMATNFTGNLSGDVTGTQSATVVARLAGQSASAVVAGATAANAATAASTANTIVKRDGSGNFAAGAITATSLTGNGANLTSLSATNLATGTVPLARLSGITSNQLDAATWQFLVALASGGVNGPTTGTNGMVLIPGGSFTMGDTLDGDTDAKPVTNVFVSPFYMDVNLVTWSQWQGVYGYATNHGYTLNPGAGKGAAHPVQSVNWYDVVKWCNARSEQAGKVPVYYTDAGLTVVYRSGEVAPYANWSAKGYRLPTEAEWEKAARGGLAGQRFPWGNLISQTNANYYGMTGSYAYDLGPNGYNPLGVVGGSPYTSPVGSFAPNGYGLYDMAGNVWQWCWDWYGTPYAGGTDPRGVSTGSLRVLGGGGWFSFASVCRTAGRSSFDPAYGNSGSGFRSALPPGQ